MPTFRDIDQLYRVLDGLFARVAGDPALAAPLLAGKFVLRFRYSDPGGQVTVDLRGEELSWTMGDSELTPDVEMIQSADVAHLFWLGRLNVPTALATRKVVARGPVAKALKLLPAVKPIFAVYPEVLVSLGMEQLIPQQAGQKGRLAGWRRRLERAVDRGTRTVRSLLPGGQRPLSVPRVGPPIPLADGPLPQPIQPREVELPADEVELKRLMLRRMMEIRAFEQKLAALYAAGDVPTEAIHLSVGQEAVAVGVCFALRADDAIATTHRGHGHMLAKGADLYGMMAEILAKSDGLCGGKGGSMHVTDAGVGAIGANGIVGASPLLAAGSAHAAMQQGSDRLAVAFLGDGATNQGMFHEGLNFASVLGLPCLFVVENNLYGEFTPQNRHMRAESIAKRAAAYGIEGRVVDGNDVWAVYEAAKEAVQSARQGGGPLLLECLTYRWHGHMEGEAVDYRPAEEIQRWKQRCPIVGWQKALVEGGLLSDDEAGAMAQGADEAVEDVYRRAEAADEPPPQTLSEEIFAPEPAALYRGQEVAPGSREITCSAALFEALAEEMQRDESVYLLGEDVSTGGYFAVTVGLSDKFGLKRIIDTPISEYAIVGSAVGAAMAGQRPVAEILFSDFLTTCMDPLVNQAAKLRYMSGGQYTVPMVVRTPGGAGLGMAAQHSQSLEALLCGVPGLIVLAPATPYDAKGLLKAAIRSQNPVLFFENKLLYTATGPVPEDDYTVPMGKAKVQRRGSDVTVVSLGAVLGRVLEAAEQVSRTHGIEAEVVDLRTLVPLDLDTIITSVAKTGRLVTVEDGCLTCGFGAEVLARVTENAFALLKTPPQRVAAKDVPLPYNRTLENLAIPDTRAIRASMSEAMR